MTTSLARRFGRLSVSPSWYTSAKRRGEMTSCIFALQNDQSPFSGSFRQFAPRLGPARLAPSTRVPINIGGVGGNPEHVARWRTQGPSERTLSLRGNFRSQTDQRWNLNQRETPFKTESPGAEAPGDCIVCSIAAGEHQLDRDRLVRLRRGSL